MGQDWGDAEVNALTIPVYIVGFGTYLTCAMYSDRIQQRGIFCVGGAAVMIIGYALLLAHQSTAMSFVGCFFISAGLWTCSGSGMAWVTVNQPRYGKRAFASGIFIAMVVHTTLYFHLKKKNKRKLAGDEDWRMEGKTEEEINEMGEHNPRYLYTL